MAENWLVAIRRLNNMGFKLPTARRYQLRLAYGSSLPTDRDQQNQWPLTSLRRLSEKRWRFMSPRSPDPKKQAFRGRRRLDFEAYVKGAEERSNCSAQGKIAEADQLLTGPQKDYVRQSGRRN